MNTVEEDTFFAPGSRDSMQVVEEEAALLAGAQIGQQILDAIPDLAMVLNDKRQIVAANVHCLTALGLAGIDELMGKRPGEVVHCVHAFQGPMGCGTSECCRQCGAAKSILTCLQTEHSVQYECRITSQGPEGEIPLEFLAKASFVRIGKYPLVLLVLRDISAEKRKQTLERLFFHDVLNSVGGMIGLADLMVSDQASDSKEYARIIQHLAEGVAEEISAYRNLVQAESGSLQIDPINLSVSDLLDEIVESLSHHPVSSEKRIEAHTRPDCCIRTDPVLLRRIVSNLGKNALEASADGSIITLSGVRAGETVEISVHNPGVIPIYVQSQLFKRSFSTKGETGRGLGTYSIKLFAERYLHGRVTFSSMEGQGTTFKVTLPSLERQAIL